MARADRGMLAKETQKRPWLIARGFTLLDGDNICGGAYSHRTRIASYVSSSTTKAHRRGWAMKRNARHGAFPISNSI